MGKKFIIKISQIFLILYFLFSCLYIQGQSDKKDTLITTEDANNKYDQFYDSLAYKAKQKKITSLVYDLLVSPHRKHVDQKALSLEYYSQMEGKIISDISITALNVFGPTFNDTTRTPNSLIEKTANILHTKSNLNTIKKMLLFKRSDFLDPGLMYETERLIRSLPYIQDLRIMLKQDSLYKGLVKVHIITKDRFSIGATGAVNGGKSADLEIYNQNIFGVGHEISLRFMGHLKRQPYMGLETFYKIKNIRGKFIDIMAGYMNTYRQEGFSISIDKQFITPTIKWGYGGSAMRMFRTDRIFEDDPLKYPLPINLSYYSAWGGHSFQINSGNAHKSQMVLSGGFYNRTYYQRPVPSEGENQYFSNSTFLLTGLTFTQRRYIQDRLVYSYGITEDIPEGFRNEIVYGYDFNEFGNRHYAHINLSNGNLLINHQGYLYLAGAIGGYFNRTNYEQGMIKGSLNFISRQIEARRKRFRLFLRANYLLGIRRFAIENLNLNYNDYIRGFSSDEAIGQQRLSVNLEYVLFLRREFYKFNMAVFGFTDVGVIGSNQKFIFTEDYYSGLGIGLRLHNENLVFKTFQLRLAFYPFAPSDMNFVGFIVHEQVKKDFYSFQPTPPQPIRFR